MRTFRVFVVAVVAAGTLLVLVPGASASAPAVSKTCQSLNTLEKKLAAIDPSSAKNLDYGQLGEIGSAFHKAAKTAPKKLKSALNTIGDVYQAMGDAGSPSGALSAFGKNAQKYTKAFQTFGTYLATNCSSSSISTSTTTG